MLFLTQAHASRIVVTSSTAHNGARLDIDDLHFRNRCSRLASLNRCTIISSSRGLSVESDQMLRAGLMAGL